MYSRIALSKQEMLIVNLYDKLKNADSKIPLFFNLGASYEFYTD